MITETAGGPQGDPIPQGPLAIFDWMEAKREEGNIPDFLRGVDAISTTEAINEPDLLGHLRLLGRQERVWTGVVDNLEQASKRDDPQAVARGLHLAELLGMDEITEVADFISQLRQKFSQAARRTGQPPARGGGLMSHVRSAPPESRAPRKGFVEEIDDILAGESGPEGKVFASPRRLAGYLQSLPLPQGASLQNPNIEILDGRSARAQGEISKWGKSSFIVMLASDREAGELQVQSHNLTAVAGRHKSHVGEINQALGNIISILKDQLNGQLADKAWKTAGFSIHENGNDFVIKFNRELIDQEKEQLQEVRQAREELQGSLDRRQQWAKRLKKERPSNREIVLASPLFKDKTQEEIEAMANELFESDADSIVKGKFGLDEELMQKLLQLYHPDEVRVLEDLIIQKVDQAGDEPQASAWRSNLEEPAAIAAAAQNLKLSDSEQAHLAEEVEANYYSADIFKQPATAVDKRGLVLILSKVASQWDKIQHAAELGEPVSPAGRQQVEEIAGYLEGHKSPLLLARQLLALSLAHPLKTYFEDREKHGELTAIIRAIDIIQRIMALKERVHE